MIDRRPLLRAEQDVAPALRLGGDAARRVALVKLRPTTSDGGACASARAEVEPPVRGSPRARRARVSSG